MEHHHVVWVAFDPIAQGGGFQKIWIEHEHGPEEVESHVHAVQVVLDTEPAKT